jgi:hypothetical protein
MSGKNKKMCIKIYGKGTKSTVLKNKSTGNGQTACRKDQKYVGAKINYFVRKRIE